MNLCIIYRINEIGCLFDCIAPLSAQIAIIPHPKSKIQSITALQSRSNFVNIIQIHFMTLNLGFQSFYLRLNFRIRELTVRMVRQIHY
jgi:hypothetical protein